MSSTTSLSADPPPSPPNQRQCKEEEETKKDDNLTIGFIGLGKIGYALAKNILTKSSTSPSSNNNNDKAVVTIQKALHYDIDTNLCTKFASEVSITSTTASSIKEVAESCHVVFTALPNDAILRSVVSGDKDDKKEEKGMNEYLRPNSIHVSCSTVSPATSRFISSEHAKKNVKFVAAPIFARPDGLALGHATIPISSSYEHASKVIKPLLEKSATKVEEISNNDAGAANVVKLAGNFLIASAIESLSEAYTFCEAQDVPRQTVHDLLSSTIFDCLIYKGYGQRIASRDHTPYPNAHFALDLGKKDVKLVKETAKDAKVKMPTVELLNERFEEATKEKKRGDLDWSAIGLSVSEEAGMNVEEYEKWCRRENPKIDWKPPT